MDATADAWIESVLARDPVADADLPLERAWLRRTFDEHGPVSRDDLLRLHRDQELVTADAALRLVLADLERTTDLRPPLTIVEQGGALMIGWNGIGDGNSLPPVDVVGIGGHGPTVVAVAEELQDQLGDGGLVWPVCSTHNRGLHAISSKAGVAWTCSGGHTVAAIGELPAPGERRRT